MSSKTSPLFSSITQLPKKTLNQVLEFKLQLLIIFTIPLQSMNQATNFLNFHLFTTYAAK